MSKQNKATLIAEIKQLRAQRDALEIHYLRYNKSVRVLTERLRELEAEQLKVNVEIWRKENEAGVEQLQIF